MGKKPKIRKLSRKYVDGDKHEHDLSGAIEIDLTKGSLEELVGQMLDAHYDDSIIKEKSKMIRRFLKTETSRMSALEVRWHVGRILQFVDKLNLKGNDARREAFQRLFDDLKVDPERNPSAAKLTRYPTHMYTLAQLPKELVFTKGMTWSRWFDILEYKHILRDRRVLKNLVRECCKHDWPEDELRRQVQSLNKKLKSRKYD